MDRRLVRLPQQHTFRACGSLLPLIPMLCLYELVLGSVKAFMLSIDLILDYRLVELNILCPGESSGQLHVRDALPDLA